MPVFITFPFVTVDYIILGRGICGSLLAWNLLQQGASVVVIHDVDTPTATGIASGLINPVTGKRLVQSWMYETLLPVALETYKSMEEQYHIPLLRETELLQFHSTSEAASLFAVRQAEEETYLRDGNEAIWKPYFETAYGIGIIDPCWLIDGRALLEHATEGITILNESFDWNACTIHDDNIVYKNIQARKVICCDGAAGAANLYFSLLPFSLNKGEVVIARIPGLPHTHIYQRDLKIVPWKDDLFWIGSSFEWKYSDLQPTTAFLQKVKAALTHWLKLPYEIVDHWAAERPSPVDYRPFVGLHPHAPAVGILNGMGTKGFLQAPYFAKCLADYLINGTPLPPEADIARFQRVLSRR